MPPVILRSASSHDGPHILKLLETVDLPTADLRDSNWTHFFIAESGNRIVGTVGLEPAGSFALLRSLGVLPEFRSDGLGRRLLKRVEERAREIGVRQLGLITDSAPHYFSRLGFTAVERIDAPAALSRTRQFREICPDSATLMLKSTG